MVKVKVNQLRKQLSKSSVLARLSFEKHLSLSLSLAMVVRVWNALEKEKMMARLRKVNKEKEMVKCPTLEALPPGWNRINVWKLNGIRAKYYLAPSGMRSRKISSCGDFATEFCSSTTFCPKKILEE